MAILFDRDQVNVDLGYILGRWVRGGARGQLDNGIVEEEFLD